MSSAPAVALSVEEKRVHHAPGGSRQSQRCDGHEAGVLSTPSLSCGDGGEGLIVEDDIGGHSVGLSPVAAPC